MSKLPIFSQLFAKSPVQPIQKHMKAAYECASHLPEFFEAVLEDDWKKAKKIGTKIRKLESDADDLKRSIRLNLPRSLFMPVSRTDLLELVQAQDKIPNRTKDVVGLTLSRHMQFPSELGPLIIELASKTVSASQLAFEALKELDELFHSGFSGSEIDLITGMLAELNDVEHETDVLQGKLRDSFFSIEKDLNPVDVMFFYRMIEWIGEIADNSQSVGNRLLYLIAK